jgi:predicted ferric reductase
VSALSVVPRLRGLAPPALALGLMIAAFAWAWPVGLPVWRTTGIVCAWAGTGALVASLVLMIREPRLARTLGGLEAMYRWHHRAGVVGYVLLLMHPLALAQDAWQEAPARAWLSLAPWKQHWAVTLGWVALAGLMLGLAVTFAPRVGYRRWRGVHIALGPVVMLGLVHVLVLLGHDALVWAAIATATVGYGLRLAISDLGVQARPYRIATVSRPAAALVEVTLQPLAGAMAVAPGQFVLARFVDSDRYRACGEFHPFTVSGIDADGSLRLTIKALGRCSTQIQAIAPDSMVRLQGPFGSFLDPASGVPRLWVAGGIGITPFMAALRHGPCAVPTTLVYLYRRPGDAAFADELHALASSDPNLQLIAEATGDAPPDVAALLERVDGLAAREVHVCGPVALVQALLPELSHRGVGRDSIHHESFDFR